MILFGSSVLASSGTSATYLVGLMCRGNSSFNGAIPFQPVDLYSLFLSFPTCRQNGVRSSSSSLLLLLLLLFYPVVGSQDQLAVDKIGICRNEKVVLITETATTVEVCLMIFPSQI